MTTLIQAAALDLGVGRGQAQGRGFRGCRGREERRGEERRGEGRESRGRKRGEERKQLNMSCPPTFYDNVGGLEHPRTGYPRRSNSRARPVVLNMNNCMLDNGPLTTP